MFFLAKPHENISVVFDYLESFGSSSGLKVNVTKSELLILSGGNTPRAPNSPNLKVTIATSPIKYLGVNIGRTPRSIYDLNYPPLITKMIRELDRWGHLPISLLPRCHLMKMVSFPKLLYPLQTIPLLLKHTDLNKLMSAYTKCVWNGKRPRIAMKKLMRPILKGGINLPDIRCYNLASLLRHGADWIKNTNYYSNLALEKALVSPWSLPALLHTKYASLPRMVRGSLLLTDTLAAWKTCRKSFKVAWMLSKHMTIWNHPEFTQGIVGKQFKEWREKGIITVGHLINMEEKRYLTFPELQTKYQLSSSHYLTYCQ